MIFVPVINFVLERLYDLSKYEASILRVDEQEEIQGLQRELELIDSHLKDIDELQRHREVSNVLQTKIKHLMDIISKIEKFLDARASGQRIRSSCFQEFNAFFSCTSSNPVIRKHQVVDEITRIQEGLSDLRTEYNLPTNNSQDTYKKRPQTTPNIIQEEIIVGIEEDVSDLVAEFVGKQGKRGANSAIVGMGGLGKTTLARKFYNHQKIMEVFPRRAWVCVSQEWNTDDLLLQICALLGIELPKVESSTANVKLQPTANKLQEFLNEYSCLVVLDDVWERTALAESLPTLLSGKGRVLITTRNQGIVRFIPRIPSFYIHEARRLTRDESWELFSRVVCDVGRRDFGDDEEFAKLGREMIRKCDGLPLAIVALAGLLGTKTSLHQWESIKDVVISRIMEDGNEVKKILEFSYLDLSYGLKPCFLYLGTFKEDEEIDVDILINLWMDEGFLRTDQRRARSRKDVAKDLLDELVQRCLVQVVSRDYADDIKTIRIHDLIRDLCIDKAMELNFFQVSSPSTSRKIEINPTCHRAIIYERKSILLRDPGLRTFIFRERDLGIKPPSIVTALPGDSIPFGKLKHVRVLYLDGVDLHGDSVQQIGKMVLLRYLRFGFYIRNLENVAFIKKLKNLQTLIYNRSFWGRGGYVKWPVNMVSSLGELRVLCLQAEAESDDVISQAISGVGKLERLQTLHAQAGEWLVQELHTFINTSELRELRLNKIRNQQQVDVLYECVSETLTHLESLRLELVKGSGLGFDLEKMKLASRQSLKCLHLRGKIIKRSDEPCPDWLVFPPRLLSLSLVETEIQEGEEEYLKRAISKLTQLRELFLLQGSYKGEYLTFSVELVQLQRLTLEYIYDLEGCSIMEGCLPQLQELTINACNNLGGIPAGIETIRTLKLLKISSMVDHRFFKRLKKREEGETEGGEDFHLVQHIPNITYPSWSFEASIDRYD